jgi:hypothetical protein
VLSFLLGAAYHIIKVQANGKGEKHNLEKGGLIYETKNYIWCFNWKNVGIMSGVDVGHYVSYSMFWQK